MLKHFLQSCEDVENKIDEIDTDCGLIVFNYCICVLMMSEM